MSVIDFDLKLSRSLVCEVELLNSPFGRTSPLELVMARGLENLVSQLRNGRLNRDGIKQLGADLFQSLFPGRIGEIWQRCKTAHQVRLRLDIRDVQLHGIPWELIRDDGVFLALTEKFPIVRFEQNFPYAIPDKVPKSLSVLIIAATPLDTAPLPGVKSEIKILREVLGRAGCSSVHRVKVVEGTTYEKFVESMGEGFDVVHFVGHGAFKDNRGFLIFEDKNSSPNWCEAETIGDLVRNSNASLMVLNACETAVSSSHASMVGVAKAVHTAGVPSVVAMQQVIRDDIAPIFAQSFYEALVKGFPLEKCMTSARLASKNAQGNDGVEWAIPALFSNKPLKAKQGTSQAATGSESPKPSTNIFQGNYGPSVGGNVTNLTIYSGRSKPED